MNRNVIPRATTGSDRASPARIINVLLGIWLFISAFAWPHTGAQMTNTWIVGVFCVVFAFVAMNVPQVRFANTLLAIWLFVSAFALPGVHSATIWNNILVALGIFLVSLVPGSAGGPRDVHRALPRT